MIKREMVGYLLHGLKVNSELIFEGYKSKKVYKRPHAVLRIGEVKKPELGLEDTLYRPFTIANKNIFYQEIPSIAKYLIEGKDQVTIDIYHDEKIRATQLFFLDSILPILLIKNGKFAVHASAVKTKNGIFLFCAARGNGKSSLAASLVLAGAKVISDDICILKWDEKSGKFLAKCYHPHIQLWRNIIPIFGKRVSEFKKTRVREGLMKFSFDFSNYSYKSYFEVAGIVFLNVINEDLALELKEIKGFAKINLSRNILHTNQVSQYIAQHKRLFAYSSHIAKNLKLYMINRSRVTKLNELSKYVIEKIIS